MIFLRLLAVGGVVALLLWAMEDRGWITAISFLFPFFTFAAAAAIGSFEAQDGIQRSAALLGLTAAAAFAPGLMLTLADTVRTVSHLSSPLWVFGAGLGYAVSVLVMLGWLVLPAIYGGASLCRDWMRQRPASDMALWALMTTLFAAVWFSDVHGGFWALSPLGWFTTAFLYGGSAAIGAGLGWLFHRWTGYPSAR